MVAVTHGWSEDAPLVNRNDRYVRRMTPLSAMVLDHAYNYEVVARYDSDAGGWPLANRRGAREALNRAAIEMAAEKARELNDELA